MQRRFLCATLRRLQCVLGLAAVACSGQQSRPPRALQTGAAVTGASAVTSQSPAPVAAPPVAGKAYVAEPSTEVALNQVRDLTWPPPEFKNLALPAECLPRKLPLARTCRYPGTAKQRLSAVLLDAYEASHPDPEQLAICERPRAHRERPPRLMTAEEAAASLEDKQRRLDAKLAELEGCPEFPSGFVRALRAHEYSKCADALAQIPLERGEPQDHSKPDRAQSLSTPTAREPRQINEFWRDLLYGEALAAVFERWFVHPLQPVATAEPPQFGGWVKRVLQPHFEKGRAQLESARSVVERLPEGSNGRQVAEYAFWNAEHRMFQNARAVQIPDALKKDYVLRTSFYGALDQAAQPFNEVRDRDHLSDCLQRAEQGWLDDSPLFWKSKVFWWQTELHCSTFTKLPLPFPLAPRQDPRQTNDPTLSLAATLPPAFVDALLSDERRIDPEVHRALLARGVPRTIRQFASAALAREGASLKQNQDLHLALARSEFRLGLVYAATKRWERAKIELEFAPDSSETRLLRALVASLLSAGTEPNPNPWRGSCTRFGTGVDTSALHGFLSRAGSEPKDIVAIAEAAVARLALECQDSDIFLQNAKIMVERAEAVGAFYLLGCWRDDGGPFRVGNCDRYPCLPIPWQGR